MVGYVSWLASLALPELGTPQPKLVVIYSTICNVLQSGPLLFSDFYLYCAHSKCIFSSECRLVCGFIAKLSPSSS